MVCVSWERRSHQRFVGGLPNRLLFVRPRCCGCSFFFISCCPRSVPESLKLLSRLMWAPETPTDGFLNATTVKLFTTAYVRGGWGELSNPA